MFESFIATAIGAGVVVIIDWIVRYSLYRKKNFQAVISIQSALHQMLAVSLQIRKFYDERKEHFLKVYDENKIGDDPEITWCNFRHVDFPTYMNTFDIVNFDWDFTQFLSNSDDKTRKILNKLIPARLGFQSLMFIIKERNDLIWFVQQRIEQVRVAYDAGNDFEYVNDNLRKIIGLPIDEKLRGMTNKFIETMDDVIEDCNKAFCALSTYIDENFCCAMPLTLNIAEDLKQLLEMMAASERGNSGK